MGRLFTIGSALWGRTARIPLLPLFLPVQQELEQEKTEITEQDRHCFSGRFRASKDESILAAKGGGMATMMLALRRLPTPHGPPRADPNPLPPLAPQSSPLDQIGT